jgi:uncharacterized delta-60 repeat protein
MCITPDDFQPLCHVDSGTFLGPRRVLKQFKFIVVLLALVLVQVPLFALVLIQQRTWGGPDLDEGSAVATAPDNSAYVAGTTLSFGVGDRDAVLLKYDAAGALVWQRTFGTASSEPFFRADEFAQGVAVSPDGSAIYMTGQFGNGSVFVAKFDPAGTLVWQRTWGDNGNFANGIAVGADGSVYVAGGTSTFDIGQGDVIVFKLTADGALEWDLTWGGPGFDAGRDIAVGADGGIYIAGETNSFVANDAFLIKVSAAGVVLWERDWGALNRDGFPGLTAAFGVGTAPDGSVYITGNASDVGTLENTILVKFTPNGDLVWQGIGGPGFGGGLDVAVAPDGELFVSGSILADTRDPSVFGGFAFIAQFSAEGKKRKALVWGGSPQESTSAESIAVSANGTIAVAGWAQNPPYFTNSSSNSLRSVDAFLEIVTGTITDPPALLDEAPGGQVTVPAGSETFGGVTDVLFLRLQR